MKIKVLVVDDNTAFVDLIEKYFNGSEEIQIIHTLENGLEAVKVLNDLEYDVLLLDLVMPIKDGLYVLKYMKEHNINKKVIVMSSFNGEDLIREVNKYNVKYFALKPFDMEDLKDKIVDIYNGTYNSLIDNNNHKIQLEITKLLHNLGIPSNMKGYQYIRSAIQMVYENPNFIGGITKELYPDLSIKYNTSTQRVERAMRHAIEVSWLRGDIDLMEEIFGHSVDIDKAKPTNSEFIVTLADKLRLDMIGAN